MNKVEYFTLAMNEKLYMKRQWIIDAFCVIANRPTFTEAKYHGQLIVDPAKPDTIYWYNLSNPTAPEAVPIEGSSVKSALFGYKDTVNIKANTIPMINEDMNTTYGIILGNMILLYYPFKGKLPFSHKVIGGWIEDDILLKLKDNPKPGEQEDPNSIYVYELEKLGEACGFLSSLATVFTSSGSYGTVTVHPDVLKLRDKLIEENKDKLTDKTTLALIEEQLVKADKASFSNDKDAQDFLISGKAYNPTRKKMFTLIGGTSGFGQGGSIDFINGSLRDKWKVEDIPLHADEARSGSYFRGKETQFGGADVKVAYRMTMSMSVSDDFCGTTKGKAFSILPDEKATKYLGRYVATANGPVEITKEVFEKLKGKTVQIYSPQFCKSPGSKLCPICVGKTYSALKFGIPSAVANIGDVFMYDKMKRMHGKPLDPVYINLNSILY